MKRQHLAALIVVELLAVPAAMARVTYSVTDLGTLGGTTSVAYGVNNKGQIAGYSALPGNNATHAFLYTNGIMTDLGTLGGANVLAYAINDSGQVVGYSDVSSNTSLHAFSYANGVMTDLNTLGGLDSVAIGINNNGQIVGWSNPTGSGAEQAFSYSGGGMINLGTLGGTSVVAYGINNQSQIAGFSDLANNSAIHAFLYKNNFMTDLLTLGGQDSEATALNNNGQVVGWSNTTNNGITHAFIFTNGVMNDLGTLGGTSVAYGINDSGQVVGYSDVSGNSNPHAFLYSGGVMLDLNNLIPTNSGWSVLEYAYSINDNSQIVGYGLNSSNQFHAFLLSITLNATLGVDVSHYNNDATNTGVIDFGTAANNGLNFVLVKLTQGTVFTDPEGAQNIQGAVAAGLLAAPYHLAGRQINGQIALQDATAEATYFLNKASGYIRNGYLPPILDVEAKFDGTEAGYAQLTGQTLFQWVSAWLQFVQQNTGVTPIVYANYSVLPLLQSITNSYPLWIASEDNDPTSVPTSGSGEAWPQWMFKQYASDLSTEPGHWPGIPDTTDANGIAAVDLDSFNGSYAQLAQMTNYPPYIKITGLNWTPMQGPTAGSFNFQVFSASASSVSVATSLDLANWGNQLIVPISPNRVGVFLDSSASSQVKFYSVNSQ